MTRRLRLALVLSLVLVAGMACPAFCLIWPDFTPYHLKEQAEFILLLKLKAPAAGQDKVTAEIVRVLKGGEKAPKKAQTIDLSAAVNPEQGKAVREMITAVGDGPVLFFEGKGKEDKPVSLLHMGGKWVALMKAEKLADTWELDAISGEYEACWAGGTDMLLKLTELLLRLPDTSVPVDGGASWGDLLKPGKVAGKVRGMRAVDLAGKGQPVLFVASEGGDQLFQFDRKANKFENATARLKLGTKSQAWAWADFNVDGRLDLASSDGKGLALWLQAADGSFAAEQVAAVPEGGCLGLAALDAGVKGRAGLLWWGPAGAPPTLLVPDAAKAGTFTAKPLAGNAAAAKDLGAPGRTLVADFDGDGLADALQLFAKGSFLFKGKGPGEFAEGAKCPVALGSGRTEAFTGDWDADGRLDVFALSEDCCRLWQNLGDGAFQDRAYISGELAYISKPGGIDGNVCDINNDGLQDVFIAYGDQGPQTFFNRGFRSFGHAHRPLDLTELNEHPEALKGQQAGMVADLTGDGAQDMAIVQLDGELLVFPRAVTGEAAASVKVALPVGGAYAGPLTVTADTEERRLGAWSLMPGVAEAFLARSGSGRVTFTWKLPGGEAQKGGEDVEDEKAKRFVIGANKK